MNEALYRLPLLCTVVEDGYGRSCGFSRLIGGLIVSKLELEALYRLPLLCRVVEDTLCGRSCGFSSLIGGQSTTSKWRTLWIFNVPAALSCDYRDPKEDALYSKAPDKDALILHRG